MAISLSTAPESYQPAWNPIEFSFTSTNVAKCDFTYICDVYVNGALATRLKAQPDANNSFKGTFRIERVLQDFMKPIFGREKDAFYKYLEYPFTNGLMAQRTDFGGGSICSYYIQIRESFNAALDCLGTVTVGSVLYTSPTNYAWDAALDVDQQYTYTQTKYLTTGNYSKVLTNKPRIKLPYYGANNDVLYIMQTNLNSPNVYVERVLYKAYDYNGSLQFSNAFTVTGSPTTLTTKITSFAHSPFMMEYYGFLNNDTTYYTLQFASSTSVPLSEIKTFDVERKKFKHSPHRVYWLNKLGGYDSYHFDMANFSETNTQRTDYNKYRGTNALPYDRGTTTISVDTTTTYNLNSNFVTQQEAQWLSEILESPDVFMTIQETIRVPISSIGDDGTYVYFNVGIERYEWLVTGNPIKWKTTNLNLFITGAIHNMDNTASLIINDSVSGTLPIGTVFNYNAPAITAIGSPSFGLNKVITSYLGASTYKTDIVSTINAGAVVSGNVYANTFIGGVNEGCARYVNNHFGYNILETDIKKSLFPVQNGSAPPAGSYIDLEITRTIPVVPMDSGFRLEDLRSKKLVQYPLVLKASNDKNTQSR